MSKNEKDLSKILSKCISYNLKERLDILNKIKLQIRNEKKIEDLLLFFQTLSNPIRLKIFYILMKQDCCVCEIQAILGISQPAISKHLKKLEDLKLIKGRKEGRFSHYSIIKQEFEKYLGYLFEMKNKTENWFGEIY
ncbi:MAG: ArsR/SmtB family transcription factor [Promethearchaeota archaeon]